MERPPDQALELFRSRSGLAVDDEGRLLHRGEPVTHARTLEVLWSSLSRTEDGRWRVQIGRERAYVEVAETPWVVRGVIAAGADAPPTLLLSDGTREPLDPATLRIGEGGVLRCRVNGGEPARFSRAGQVALGLSLDEDPPGSGRLAITLGGVRWPING